MQANCWKKPQMCCKSAIWDFVTCFCRMRSGLQAVHYHMILRLKGVRIDSSLFSSFNETEEVFALSDVLQAMGSSRPQEAWHVIWIIFCYFTRSNFKVWLQPWFKKIKKIYLLKLCGLVCNVDRYDWKEKKSKIEKLHQGEAHANDELCHKS